MPSKLKSSPKHIIWQFSFISLIFISLVHCTTKVAEQHPPINQPSLPQNAISSQTSLPVVQNTTAVLPTIVPAVRNRPQNPNDQDFITQPIQNQPSVVERDNSLLSNIEICDSGSRIEIDISEQQLELFCHYQGNKVTKKYQVSTSKFGIGNKSGSGKTPLGRHLIKNKIGNDALQGTIFKARQNTGRIATMNQPGAGDLITTRIMWLTGLEPGKNAGRGIDSYKRYIYIHGTAEENKIGQPASHGCIRMYNRDVIELFDLVMEGTKVDIRR